MQKMKSNYVIVIENSCHNQSEFGETHTPSQCCQVGQVFRACATVMAVNQRCITGIWYQVSHGRFGGLKESYCIIVFYIMRVCKHICIYTQIKRVPLITRNNFLREHFFGRPAAHLFVCIRYFIEAAFAAHARKTWPA